MTSRPPAEDGPARGSSSPDLASVPSGPRAHAASPDPHPVGTRLLLVEDDSLLRAVTVCSLEELGIDAIGVSNAGEALEVLTDDRSVRVLMTDIRLPGMNGRALAAEVLRRWPDIQILFATGDEAAAADIGPPHLTKPYSVDQLAAALERVGFRCVIAD